MSNSWKVLVEDQVRYDSFTGAKTEQKEIWIKPENGEHVALICGAYSSMSLEERMANAHLMASAKDMYASLNRFVETFKNTKLPQAAELLAWMYEANDLLSKARGEQPNKEGENGNE